MLRRRRRQKTHTQKLARLYKLVPVLAEPRMTPVLEGTCRMQGPVDEMDLEEDDRSTRAILNSFPIQTDTEESPTSNACNTRPVYSFETSDSVGKDVLESHIIKKASQKSLIKDEKALSGATRQKRYDLIRRPRIVKQKVEKESKKAEKWNLLEEPEMFLKHMELSESSSEAALTASEEQVKENLDDRASCHESCRPLQDSSMPSKSNDSINLIDTGVDLATSSLVETEITTGYAETTKSDVKCFDKANTGEPGEGMACPLPDLVEDSNINARSLIDDLPHKLECGNKIQEVVSGDQKEKLSSVIDATEKLNASKKCEILDCEKEDIGTELKENHHMENEACVNNTDKIKVKFREANLEVENNDKLAHFLQDNTNTNNSIQQSGSIFEGAVMEANFPPIGHQSNTIDLSIPYQETCIPSSSDNPPQREPDLLTEDKLENFVMNKIPDSQEGVMLSQTVCEHDTVSTMEKQETTNEQFEKKSAVEDNSLDSDLIEDDVKVCDICGDAGLEDKLAICSACSDGAEHIYCMQIMMTKVPEGDWFCEECKKARKDSLHKMSQKSEPLCKLTLTNTKSMNIDNNCAQKLSSKMDRKKFEPVLRRLVKGISKPQSSTRLSMKRHAESTEVLSSNKKQAVASQASYLEGVESSVTKKQTPELQTSHTDNLDISNTKKQVPEGRGIHLSSINSNTKSLLSRDSSFKSDVLKNKSSVPSVSSINQPNSKVPVSGTQLKALHGSSSQISRSKINVPVLSTTDSPMLPRSSSNVSSSVASTPATDKFISMSKAADAGLLHSPLSRMTNNVRNANIKGTKDATMSGPPAEKRELISSGTTNSKHLSKSSSFKSMGSSASSLIESKIVSEPLNDSLKEGKLLKTKKDFDLGKRKLEIRSGSVAVDSNPTGGTPVVLCTSVQDSSSIQVSLRGAPLKMEKYGSKLVHDGQPTVDACVKTPTASKAECVLTPFPGISTLFTNDGPVIKSEPAMSSSMIISNLPESHSSLHDSGMVGATKSSKSSMFGTFSDSVDYSSSANLKIKGEVTPTNTENLKTNDKAGNVRSEDLFTGTKIPTSGIATLSGNKDSGSTSQIVDIINSSHGSANDSLSVGGSRSPREVSRSISNELDNLSEGVVLDKKCDGNIEYSLDKKIQVTASEELVGQTECSMLKQVFPEKEEISKHNTAIQEAPVSNCDFAIDIQSRGGDARQSKELLTGLPVTIPIGGNTLSMVFGKNVRASYNAQTNPTHKILSNDAVHFSYSDVSKIVTSNIPSFIIYPTESTVTAVKRDVSSVDAVMLDGSYSSIPSRIPNLHICPQPEPTKKIAFPDHNYLWQGTFIVRSKANMLQTFVGLQAHASTCAAPKVLDAAKKFSSRMLLDEVPRSSSWPTQFQFPRPSDEDIALYFFAKDLESYEKSYKKLLDHMLHNDFALRGTSDGVDLLIFPSNQLPVASQRWNRFLYLWGVFRTNKQNCSETGVNQDRMAGQLLGNGHYIINQNAKPVSSVASSSMLGLCEASKRDNDNAGFHCSNLKELSFKKSEMESKSSSSMVPFTSMVERESKDYDSHFSFEVVEQRFIASGKRENFLNLNSALFKQFPKASIEANYLSSSIQRSNEQGFPVDPSSIPAQKFHLQRENMLPQKEDRRLADTEDAKVTDFLVSSQSINSQVSSRKERTNTGLTGLPYTGSHYSSSVERQDNSSDSSKVVSSQSSGSQTNVDNERFKLRGMDRDKWRERGKEVETSIVRSKDSSQRDWKFQEREKDDKERISNVSGEREKDRRTSSRKADEQSGYESRYRKDTRHERYHHNSSPPHLNRTLSLRSNSHEQYYSQACTSGLDQTQGNALPSSELYADSARNPWSSKRSGSSLLGDDKGQKRLKKSYSEVYVRESSREQDFGRRSSAIKSSTDLNMYSFNPQGDISKQGNVLAEHNQSEDHSYSQVQKDSEATKPLFFSDKVQLLKKYSSVTGLNQEPMNILNQDNLSQPVSSLKFVSTIEQGTHEFLDINTPNLELALGARSTGNRQVGSSFSADRSQSRCDSPLVGEEGSLSLSLKISTSEREHLGTSSQVQDDGLPEDGLVDTSLMLFGGRLSS